jgi:hypothetical protein
MTVRSALKNLDFIAERTLLFFAVCILGHHTIELWRYVIAVAESAPASVALFDERRATIVVSLPVYVCVATPQYTFETALDLASGVDTPLIGRPDRRQVM